MPWRQVDVMTERWQFIRDARRRLVTFTELCALYGISRFTGYKWLHRAEQSGLDFLQELSLAPAPLSACDVRRVDRARPRGAAASADLGSPETPRPAAAPRPAPRGRARLAGPQHRGRAVASQWPHHTAPPARPPGPSGSAAHADDGANVIWTADYKGQFRLGDGRYCFPLTVQDGFSRYLLACRGLGGTTTAECRPGMKVSCRGTRPSLGSSFLRAEPRCEPRFQPRFSPRIEIAVDQIDQVLTP